MPLVKPQQMKLFAANYSYRKSQNSGCIFLDVTKAVPLSLQTEDFVFVLPERFGVRMFPISKVPC